ncbi:uncharacterized protein M6B38_288190 [Iris pallida]|uniref:Uncharacterized protein n=1 Tax=Iris pallida TaxID=29817 RepID=A0AAX6HVD3_IRIPA|nr:uncharacterized protein M6B38_288190 [Iris pallida]
MHLQHRRCPTMIMSGGGMRRKAASMLGKLISPSLNHLKLSRTIIVKRRKAHLGSTWIDG